jgi:hypothetical protein
MYKNFFHFHTKLKHSTPQFVSKLLPSSGEITNPKTQLTKNAAHINTIYTRETMYFIAWYLDLQTYLNFLYFIIIVLKRLGFA